MNDEKINIKSCIFGLIKSFRYSFFNIVIFEILYNLVTFLLFKPIINFLISFFLTVSGKSIILNNEIFSFFLSTPGIIMSLILLVIGIFIIYFQFAVIIGFLQAGYQKRKVNLSYGLGYGLYSCSSLFKLSSIFFGVYAFVIIPFLNFGISSSLFPRFSIPDFIVEEMLRYEGFYFVLICLVAVFAIAILIFLFVKFIFLIPSMVLKRHSFLEGAKESFFLIKNNTKRVAFLFIIVFATNMGLIILFDNLSLNESFAIARLSMLVVIILKVLISPLCLGIIFSIYTSKIGILKVKQEEVDNASEKAGRVYKASFKSGKKAILKSSNLLIKGFNKYFPIKSKARKIFLNISTLILFILAIVMIINIFKSESNRTTLIIGHRGSIYGVENSMEAIEAAMNNGADYIEIDILLSKDSIPVVVHDINLRRLIGSSRNVYDYTAAELKGFTLKQVGYEGKIATLGEICRLTKGQTKLLIELKTHGHEKESVIDRVVRIVKQFEMEDQVIYQTNEYNVLLEMKMKYPNYKIGYVIATKIGNLSKRQLNKIDADFYSISYDYVDRKLFKAIQNMNKKIFVWTINDEERMAELIEMKVDGIVTDYPDRVFKIREEIYNK